MEEHVALYWQKAGKQDNNLHNHAVECMLCPHNCILKEEQKGICKTRENHKGTLCTLAWNNPCSICLDPIEKKPLNHFLPGTKTLSIAIAGCNMRCLNCQNYNISQKSPKETANYNYTPAAIIELAKKYKTPSISFTYTEPTVYYEYMLATAKLAHQNNIKTVIVSNGYINKKPLQELCNYIDAANIDLKCFDPALHLKLTGAKLQPVLDSLLLLKREKIWLEITHLMIPQYSNNLQTFEKMCQWLVKKGFDSTPLHINRFFPQNELVHLPATPVTTIKEAGRIATQAGIKHVYLGNI